MSASPEMTRKASSRSASSALRTEPAVPSGVSSVAYDRCMPELVAVTEVGAHQAGQELHRHDGLVEAVPLEQPQHVLHDRPVDHRQQRLGLVGGHRAQPGALAAGHDDRPHAAALTGSAAGVRRLPPGRRRPPTARRSTSRRTCTTYSDPGRPGRGRCPTPRTPSPSGGRRRRAGRRGRQRGQQHREGVQQVEGGGLAEEVHRQRAVAVRGAGPAASGPAATSRPMSSSGPPQRQPVAGDQREQRGEDVEPVGERVEQLPEPAEAARSAGRSCRRRSR